MGSFRKNDVRHTTFTFADHLPPSSSLLTSVASTGAVLKVDEEQLTTWCRQLEGWLLAALPVCATNSALKKFLEPAASSAAQPEAEAEAEAEVEAEPEAEAEPAPEGAAA